MGAFSNQIPIQWGTSSYGKWRSFPINFPQRGKMRQSPLYRDNLGNWYSYFFHSMGVFYRMGCFIPVLWYISSHGLCMDFQINFPQHGKMQQNPLNEESLGCWFPYFSIVWVVFSTRSSSCGILHHTGNACVSSSISHSTGKCNKTHHMREVWKIGTYTFPIV